MFDRILKFILHDVDPAHVNTVLRVAWRSVIVLHIAFACGWLGIIGLTGFAKAAETENLKGSIAMVSQQVAKYRAQDRKDALEIEIRRLDQEIFNIKAKMAELGALGKTADSLYSQRLSELENEKATQVRVLEAFLRSNPEAYGT